MKMEDWTRLDWDNPDISDKWECRDLKGNIGMECRINASDLTEEFIKEVFPNRHESYQEEWKQRLKSKNPLGYMDSNTLSKFARILNNEISKSPAMASKIHIVFGD